MNSGDNIVHWEKHSLCCDDVVHIETTEETDSLGTRVVDNKLIHNGAVIGTANEAINIIPTGISTKDVDLLTEYCIDITLDNYNKLLHGINVNGYSSFNKDAVYNIVDNLNGEPVRRDSVDPLAKIIYHGGELPENVEDELTSFTSLNAPVMGIHYFNPWCKPGDKVILQYYVDTQDAKFLHQNIIDETFTTIVKDSFDRVLAKKTSYGGIAKVELSPFMNSNKSNYFEGETYFSIQCVDARGVASATQYFDIKFDSTEPNYYQVKLTDLNTYGIVLNNSTPEVAFKNKMKLEEMLWDVRRGTFAQGHNGIKLYNSGNDIYYLDLHKNQGDDIDNPILEDHHFYLAKGTTVNGTWTVTYQEIIQGGTVTMNGQTYTVNKSPLQWIKEDSLKLYRDENDKIRVVWTSSDTGYFDSQKHVHSSNWYDVLTTWKKNYMDNPSEVPLSDGYYYVVDILEDKTFGHTIRFPNNVSLDLNGATLNVVGPDDLESVKFINLRHNNNITIKNGKIVGPYRDTNLVDLYLNRGSRLTKNEKGKITQHYAQAEGLSTTGMFGCRYCKFENVEISHSLGYEGSIGYESGNTGKEPSGGKFNYGSSGLTGVEFTRIGYVGYDGNFHNPYNQQGYSGSVVPATSFDYKNNKNREVTPITFGNKVSIDMRYEYDEDYQQNGYTPEMDYVYEKVPYLYIRPYVHYSLGKQKEIFISFYKNSTFLKTVKTAAWLPVRIPDNATHITLTGFGITELSNGSRVIPFDAKGRALSLELYGIKPSQFRGPNMYKDCYFHDTRTIAIYPSVAESHFINNRYDKIAIENGKWKLTQYLSDFEEGGRTVNHVNIVGCNISGTGPTKGGCVVLNMNYAYNLNMINCDLIGYKDLGGIQTSYVDNCEIKTLSPNRNTRKTFDYTFFKDCTVNDYLNENGVETNTITEDVSYGSTIRSIRTEDPIDDRITFRNCIIRNMPSSKPLRRNFYHCKAEGTTYY